MQILNGKFLQRQKELLTRLQETDLQKSRTNRFIIEWFAFNSVLPHPCMNNNVVYSMQDAHIKENLRFTYPVFIPARRKNRDSCIVLLHGLNERSWEKYLVWAEYLAVQTRKPVILFPIAFHINRSPSDWVNPRSMATLLEKRKKEAGNHSSLSFANVALSSRLSQDPYRFYSSGQQTINDLVMLAQQITNGRHPLFEKSTTIDFFGYSIGSFLAEVMLMANPGNLFSSSKLFIFCGGAIFKNMYGESKYIMDRQAYERLLNYYCNEWPAGKAIEGNQTSNSDPLQRAFNSMIAHEINTSERESFFLKWKNRITGISLQKDKVMPFEGVKACMGNKLAGECFELIDFPYEYSHEAPFPANGKVDDKSLRTAFLTVFSKCASFLA